MILSGTIPISDALRSAAIAIEPDARVNSGQTLAYQRELIAEFELNPQVPHDIRVHFETAKNLFLYAWFVYRFYPVAKQHALATLEFALRERLALIDVDRYRKDAKPRLTLYPLLQAAEKESLISNTGLRAYHRRAAQQARERVSETAGRLLWAFEADSVEYDLDSAVPQDEDYAWDTLKTYQEVLPKIRNIYAHGSSSLTANVLGTFETVADLVNQLYPSSSV